MSTEAQLFAFERYVSPPVKKGRVSWLDGMAVGEVRLIPRRHTVVRGILRHRLKSHPCERYSWDKSQQPVAVRRDADEVNDQALHQAGREGVTQ